MSFEQSKVKIKIKKIIKAFNNALFPEDIKCVICDREINNGSKFEMCERCYSALPFNNGKICLKCGERIASDAKYCLKCKKEILDYNLCRAPFLYQEPITKLIKGLKYDNKKYLAKSLATFLCSCYLESNFNCDVVVPVPLHGNRFKARGYNQAQILSDVVCDNLRLPQCNDLIRVKDTITQTNLTKSQREENVLNAFKVNNKNQLKNKKILLIDDVYTTGSTLNECSKVLKRAGAKGVYCLTIAHTHTEQAL